jgi:hypothetical protein
METTVMRCSHGVSGTCGQEKELSLALRRREPIDASVQELGGGANTQRRLLSGRRQIHSLPSGLGAASL